jgi:uncharacterized protein
LFCTCLIALTLFLSASAEEPKKPDRVRALIVTGVDLACHNWKETAPAIREVLQKDQRVDARIVEDPDFLVSAAASDYDVIVLDFKDMSDDDVTRWHFPDDRPLLRAAQVRESLAALVKRGKGLVVMHFACGAFDDWPEFANLAGRVWNRELRSHDPRGPFTVKIVQPQHPIVQGMKDFEADDELFTCLVGARPVEMLATAHSRVTGQDHPMAFVFEYGKGRVFHTPLGHDGRAIEMPGVAELIRRGCLWAAGRQP